MLPIYVIKGATATKIVVHDEHPIIGDVRSYIYRTLVDYEWDNRARCRRTTATFASWDPETRTVCIPVELTDGLIEVVRQGGFDFRYQEEEPVKPLLLSKNIKMQDWFEPREHQGPIIEYLSKIKPARKGLATTMGSGKTVSTIASVVKARQRTIFIASGLHHQWANAILKFTTANEDQVYTIQGNKSLMQLMDAGDYKPDFIVCSLETLRAYVNYTKPYEGLPKYDKFIEYFGIGAKVIDEAHMNFHAGTLIDMSSNITNNIYLSGTFTAAKARTKYILNRIYPPKMRYGEEDYKNYIDVYTYYYRGNIREKAVCTARGYMHHKFEKELMRVQYKLKSFFEVIKGRVDAHWLTKKKDGDKLAIYFYSNQMIDYAVKWFKENYPDYKVMAYVGGSKESVLEEADIIITRPRKSGTGTDIKQLFSVIMSVSAKAETFTQQLRGRLRELPDGRTPEYVEIVDGNLPAQVRHAETRARWHRKYAKNYYPVVLPG